MNLAQFIEAFNVKFYAVTSVSSLGWTDEEICEFFNSAQLQLVEELASMGNLESISDLVKESSAVSLNISSAEGKQHSVNVTGIADYFYYIDGVVSITKTEPVSGAATYPLDKINIKDVSKFTTTPENITFFRHPKVALGNNTSTNLTIIVDNYTTVLNSITIKYVKKPELFATPAGTTDLNIALHNRIISGAVEIAAKSLLSMQTSNK